MPTLELAPRTGRAKHLRKSGRTPVVLIGRDHVVHELAGDTMAVRQALGSPDEHGRIALRVDGRETGALVTKVDYDVLALKLVHVALREVADDDTVRVEVPVVVVGQPEEAEAKGVELMPGVDHVTIIGKLSDIPDHVEIDASELHVGEHLEASDIALPEGVELASPAEQTVATMEVIEEPELETPVEKGEDLPANPGESEPGESHVSDMHAVGNRDKGIQS